MELRHLHYFIAVAEELHFGRAAARLGMAQPPLSQQIRRLEEELGVLLLERDNRRQVKLTSAGATFLLEARAAVAQAEQAVLAARRAARGQQGHLAIGLVGSVTFDILPVILKTFHTRYPDVGLTLRELTSCDQLDALRQDRIQLGFMLRPAEAADLEFEPLLAEPLIVAIPESHPLATRDVIDLTELAGEPFILSPPNSGCGLFRDLVLNACQKAGFSPRIAQQAIQIQTIIGLVAGELGLALVPGAVQSFQRRGVLYRPLKKPAPLLEIALAHRAGERSPLVQSFSAVAREVVSAVRPAPSPGLRLISPAS